MTESPTYSGDTRTVKHLLFPYFTIEESMATVGQKVYVEKTGRRGDVLQVSDLRDQDLEKGERLGSFFNDEELALIGDNDAREETSSLPEFDASEAGEHEIAEYITEHQLNVDQTVALSSGDADTAQRVLEAESLASGGDSRKGVVAGLEKVIERASQ